MSNLPPRTALKRLVHIAIARWRIERDYQELKQEIGLRHYEGRGWRGFHHHASLCIAAYGFLVAERCLSPLSTASPEPKSAPTGFIRQRWASLVLPGGAIDRRHYELCVLSELRGHLQAGDIWVSGSRRYRSFEKRLISEDTLDELQHAGDAADRGRA